jgi:DNA mismatch repair protein MutS
MAVKESDAGVTFLRKLIPGAASTSYGIYCAELAGLPDTIISRSYDLLQAFETRAGLLEAAVGGTEVPEAQTAKLAIEERVPAAAQTVIRQEVASYARDESSGMLPIEQLSLFESNEGAKSKQSNHHDAMSSKQLKVIEQLKGADLINMTPLQAFNLIYEMKQKL